MAPEGCENYLTAGNEYRPFKHNYVESIKKYNFSIIDDDDGVELEYCLEKNCAYANGNWIVKEREKN